MKLKPKMNCHILPCVLIVMQNLYLITCTQCKPTHRYWCHKYGYEVKYPDQAFPFLNQSALSDRTCFEFCHNNNTCKVYDYEMKTGVCRFSSTLNENVINQTWKTHHMLWKKSDNMTCREELEGKKTNWLKKETEK